MYKNDSYAGNSIDSKVGYIASIYKTPLSFSYRKTRSNKSYPLQHRRRLRRRKDGFTVTKKGISFARQRRVLFQAPEKKSRKDTKKDNYKIYKPRDIKNIYSKGLYEMMLKDNLVGFVFGKNGNYKILLVPVDYIKIKLKKRENTSVSAPNKSGLEQAVSVN